MRAATVNDRQTRSNNFDLVLYKNPIDTRKSFIYPTEYDCDIREPVERILTVDTVNSDNAIKIYVLGVPDGVSPYINEAMIPDGTVRRLYIFSNKELDASNRKLVASYYKQNLYEIHTFAVPCSRLTDITVRPNFNFIIRDERLHGDRTSYMEYRYFRKRMHPANVLLDTTTGNVYPFVLPDTVPCPMIMIMPDNFTILDSKKRGIVEISPGVLIHLFSKHFLTATDVRSRDEFNDANTVTDIRILDTIHLLSFVKDCFARMGFLNVYGASIRQCVAYDSYCTAVIGEYSNVNV